MQALHKIYRLFVFALATLVTVHMSAAMAEDVKTAEQSLAVKRVNITYTINRDLRLCAPPLCGGWHVTPVNTLTMGLMSEAETLAALASVTPASTYVADLEFSCTQWTDTQKTEFGQAAAKGTALVVGQVIERGQFGGQPLKSFVVRDAFTAATKTAPLGPYLSLQNTGITCVTTPCPYYSADVLNSNLVYEFHDLSLAQVGLSGEEELAARAQLTSGALLITGVAKPYQGQAGTGTQVAATQVFWPYPARKN